MIRDLGIVQPGTTLYIPFHTFDSNDPSASVTLTGLATTDIEIYKDGSVTQRASDAGYALLDTDGIDFDATTGIHGISIDLADNTTAGFYASGSQYWVVIASVTVDAATVNFILCTFRIGYPAARLNTTIATLASQTSFTLTAGPAEDDALNGCWCIIHDVASAVQSGHAIISDYTGSTKTVTLAAGTTFTAAATDHIAIMGPMPLQPTVSGRTLAVESDGMAYADAREWLGGTIATPTATGVPEVDLTHVAGATTNVAALATNVDAILTDTADMQPKLGAPAGASISADIAAVKADTAAVLLDTGTDGVVVASGSKTGYSLTATTGLGNQTANITGNLSGSVGSVTGAVGSVTAGVTVANGGIASTSFAAGAIDAAAIAADAITSSELAQSAAQEIADEILNRDLAGGGSGNSRNVRNALRALRNRSAIATGTLTVYQEDDTTSAWTATVTTTAGDPVSQIDPA